MKDYKRERDAWAERFAVENEQATLNIERIKWVCQKAADWAHKRNLDQIDTLIDALDSARSELEFVRADRDLLDNSNIELNHKLISANNTVDKVYKLLLLAKHTESDEGEGCKSVNVSMALVELEKWRKIK